VTTLRWERAGWPLALDHYSESDGDFLFAADPRQSFNTQTIFWAPEALPTVLPVGEARLPAVSSQYDLNLSELSATHLRHAYDGWHAVVQLGGVNHRLWLRERLETVLPLAVELPLDADFDLRAPAAHRLWSALAKRPSEPTRPLLPLQRRQRLTLAMRAVDGRMEGHCYRDIAEGLFGKHRIPDRAWKTHDLRNRTIRLVQGGFALVRGGYRALLRPKRRKN
jgi:hypothetical protein